MTLFLNFFLIYNTIYFHTEQTLSIFGRNFPNEVWHSSHTTSDILMVTNWRLLSQQHPKGFEWSIKFYFTLSMVPPPPPSLINKKNPFIVHVCWRINKNYHHLYSNSSTINNILAMFRLFLKLQFIGSQEASHLARKYLLPMVYFLLTSRERISYPNIGI
jgi:hypothetical protein